VNHRPTISLTGKRWGLASNASMSCLIIATPSGPRGVALRREGDDALVYEVGGFLVFIARDSREVYTVREEGEEEDATIADEWIAASCPMLRTKGGHS